MSGCGHTAAEHGAILRVKLAECVPADERELTEAEAERILLTVLAEGIKSSLRAERS